MREELRELWRFRYLLQQLVSRELKVRYKNSALGFMWSIVPPLLQVVVYSIFMRGVANVGIKNYSAYLLCGLIPWTFFASALLDACQSLLLNFGIMRKVYLPREIIPLSYVITNTIHFLLGWVVYFVAFYGVDQLIFGNPIPVQFPAILWFPVLVFMEVALVTGLSLWLAALNVFYQDVKYIVQSLLSLLLFVMPVILTADSVYTMLYRKGLQPLFQVYMLNPMAAIITGFRHIMLAPIPLAQVAGEPKVDGKFNAALNVKVEALNHMRPLQLGWPTCVASFVICLLVAWSGYAYFNSRKWQFVERV